MALPTPYLARLLAIPCFTCLQTFIDPPDLLSPSHRSLRNAFYFYRDAMHATSPHEPDIRNVLLRLYLVEVHPDLPWTYSASNGKEEDFNCRVQGVQEWSAEATVVQAVLAARKFFEEEEEQGQGVLRLDEDWFVETIQILEILAYRFVHFDSRPGCHDGLPNSPIDAKRGLDMLVERYRELAESDTLEHVLRREVWDVYGTIEQIIEYMTEPCMYEGQESAECCYEPACGDAEDGFLDGDLEEGEYFEEEETPDEEREEHSCWEPQRQLRENMQLRENTSRWVAMTDHEYPNFDRPEEEGSC